MSSVPRLVGRSKKEKKLGKAQIVRREDLEAAELDPRIEMIRALIPLGLAEIYAVLDEEVRELAGDRYARKGEDGKGSRYGSNRGTVRLAGQRVPIRVPRVRGAEGEQALAGYRKLAGRGEVDDTLLRRVLYGISCRNYEAAAEAVPGAIGLSSSTVSRRFVEASAEQLRTLQERDLSGEDVVALFLDGKTFAADMLVLALGITMEGRKRVLGFVQAGTENERVLSPFLRSLVDRGLDVSEGVLVIVDGAKGMRAAVRKCFKERAVVQRCQWHKLENLLAKAPKHCHEELKRDYAGITHAGDREEAEKAYEAFCRKWQKLVPEVVTSLEEAGVDLLTFYGFPPEMWKSLRTTNLIERINGEFRRRVKTQGSFPTEAAALVLLFGLIASGTIRLRKIDGYPKLAEWIATEERKSA